MKISKLFHWLYAILMLLPIFAIGFSCLPYVFGEKVSAPSQSVNIQYKYETNDVESVDDIVVGNIYTVSVGVDDDFLFFFKPLDVTEDMRVYFYIVSSDVPLYLYTELDEFIGDLMIYDFYYLRFEYAAYYYPDEYAYTWYVSLFGSVYQSVEADYLCDVYFDTFYPLDDFANFNIVFTYLQNVDFDVLNGKVSACQNIPIGSVEIIEEESNFKNLMFNTLNDVVDNPFVSWAKNSFLVAPFVYITNLFGVPSTSPIITLLSYWLSISIIWLVFDLIMYVPLLVHRWIDKAGIE